MDYHLKTEGMNAEQFINLVKACLLQPAKSAEFYKIIDKHEKEDKKFYRLYLEILKKVNLEQDLMIVVATKIKNYVFSYWCSFDLKKDVLEKEDKKTLRVELLDLMLNHPNKKVRELILISVKEICDCDYYENWETLIPDLMEKKNTLALIKGNFEVLVKLEMSLKLLCYVFKQYSTVETCPEILSEIIKVYDSFEEQLNELLIFFTKALSCQHTFESGMNEELFLLCYQILIRLVKICYHLFNHSLSSKIEANMELIFDKLLYIIDNSHKLVRELLNVEPQMLNKQKEYKKMVKTLHSENFLLLLNLFNKNRHVLQNSWLKWAVSNKKFLMENSRWLVDSHYDKLVFRCVSFMEQTLKEYPSVLISSKEEIELIMNQIILPNCLFSKYEYDMYQNEPLRLFRTHLEAQDLGKFFFFMHEPSHKRFEPRRVSVRKLITVINSNFSSGSINIINEYILYFLQNSSDSKNLQNWRNRDACYFLIQANETKNEISFYGATELNGTININEFCVCYILSDLKDPKTHNLVKCSAINYVKHFRCFLDKQIIPEIFMHFLSILETTDQYLISCCSEFISRVLRSKNMKKNEYLVSEEIFSPNMQSLLTVLFSKIYDGDTIIQNEFILNAILGILHKFSDKFLPFFEPVIKEVASLLNLLCKSVQIPEFAQNLFEILVFYLQLAHKNNRNDLLACFDMLTFKCFDSIFCTKEQELLPFIFQVLSEMIHLRISLIKRGVTNKFDNLETYSKTVCLVLNNRDLWKHQANVKGICEFFISIFLNSPELSSVIFDNDKNTEQLNEILTFLVQQKNFQKKGFSLIRSIFSNGTSVLEKNSLRHILKTSLSLVCMELQKKPEEYNINEQFILTFCFLLSVYRNDKKIYFGILSLFQELSNNIPINDLIENHISKHLNHLYLLKNRKKYVLMTLCDVLFENVTNLCMEIEKWLNLLISVVEMLNGHLFTSRIRKRKKIKAPQAGGPILEPKDEEEASKRAYKTEFNRLKGIKSHESDSFPNLEDLSGYFISKFTTYYSKATNDFKQVFIATFNALETKGRMAKLRHSGFIKFIQQHNVKLI